MSAFDGLPSPLCPSPRPHPDPHQHLQHHVFFNLQHKASPLTLGMRTALILLNYVMSDVNASNPPANPHLGAVWQQPLLDVAPIRAHEGQDLLCGLQVWRHGNRRQRLSVSGKGNHLAWRRMSTLGRRRARP